MAELIKKVNDFLTKDLWRLDTESLNRFRTWLVYLVKLIYATVREFTDNELTLRTMSLATQKKGLYQQVFSNHLLSHQI